MNRRRVSKELRDRIEQLVARGRPARVIADRLGVTVDQVAAVRADMDRLARGEQ